MARTRRRSLAVAVLILLLSSLGVVLILREEVAPAPAPQPPATGAMAAVPAPVPLPAPPVAPPALPPASVAEDGGEDFRVHRAPSTPAAPGPWGDPAQWAERLARLRQEARDSLVAEGVVPADRIEAVMAAYERYRDAWRARWQAGRGGDREALREALAQDRQRHLDEVGALLTPDEQAAYTRWLEAQEARQRRRFARPAGSG